MLATRIVQKEGTFYFIAYKAAELLDRVSFTSRYYFEGEQIEADEPGEDEVARFIAGIEKSEKSFQRILNRRKIRQIVNFYETAVSQPLVPGTVLLFTDETLRFRRSDVSDSVGFLSEPDGKFLVIDGETKHPIVYSGSANMSANSVFYNDENLLEITDCPRLAQAYLAEFMRLFEHYRARLSHAMKKNDQNKPLKLTPDNSWSDDWYAKGSKANSRVAMAKT